MRGSLVTLKTGPLISFMAASSCWNCSALVTMVRNLRMVKGRPFRPERCWRKRTGPGEVSRMSRAMTAKGRAEASSSRAGADEIHNLFRDALPGGVRGAAKDQDRLAVKIVEAGARDLRLEEVRDQPDLDALEFAGADGGLDLLEVGAVGADDDAAGGVFVQHLNQPLDGGLVEVQLVHDVNAVERVRVHLPAQPGHFIAGGGHDEAAPVLGRPQFAAQELKNQFLFE